MTNKKEETIEKFENDPNFIDNFKKVPQKKTFKEECLKGNIPFSKITEYISDWEKNPRGLILKDYLGLSDEEYSAYEKGSLEKKWKNQKAFKSTAILRKTLIKLLTR